MESMEKNHSSKIKKTMNLPSWIGELLTYEGEVLGGKPGLVAAAAILMFAEAEPAQKATYLRRIHEKEVSDAYDLANQRPVGEESADGIARRIVMNARRSAANCSSEEVTDGSG